MVTCLIGVAGYVFVVDFPDRAISKKHWGFLTNNEISFIIRRINVDRNDADGVPWNLKAWASSALDLKIWGFALLLL